MRSSFNNNDAIRRYGMRLKKVSKEVNLMDLLIQKSVTVKTREDIASLFGEIVPALLRVGRASLVLRAQNEKYFIFESLGVNPEIKGSACLKASPVIEWVFSHRKPLVVNDIATDERFSGFKRSGYKTQCFICVPVFMDSEIIGAMSISDPRNRRNFSPRDLELAEMITGQFGTLFRGIFLDEVLRDRKKLYEEMSFAKIIQKRMLQTELPQLRDFDASVSLIPAREVGGDFYFMTPKGDGGWMAMLGDVAGKGVPAALTMVFSIAQLREIIVRASDPVSLFMTLHNVLADVLPDFQYLTACAAFHDGHSNKVKFCNAGHPPILLYQNNTGKIIELKQTGTAIGMFKDNFEINVETADFNAGDSIILYTDGCTDARSRGGEKFGAKRFAENFAKNGIFASAQIVENLQNTLFEFMTGVVAYDDVAMLCIKAK
ncbi:MAG: SpoIIE family protein phosphatase [Candidatus Riflebacteria bacterium]|nr:SpoIIE family protein phosphatase [Candidatus Riflebacteria bacterium]